MWQHNFLRSRTKIKRHFVFFIVSVFVCLASSGVVVSKLSADNSDKIIEPYLHYIDWAIISNLYGVMQFTMWRQQKLALALLFIAFWVPSNAQSSVAPTTPGVAAAPAPLEESKIVFYDVGRYFALNCSFAPVAGSAIVWKKNETAVENIGDLTGRYALDKEGAVFRMTHRTTEDDFGNYTCSLDGASQAWEVRGRPHAKLQHNTNVVENQKIKIVCKVTGKPYPAVTWTFSNATLNGSSLAEALGPRAQLTESAQGVPDAALVLEAAARSDAGVLECAPAGGVAAATTLRVKDQYAALWPFLGICAEVFVLCAIILVYEKRRTKPELDDSDADNHDQKKS